MKIPFNRQKYLDIMNSQGLHVALTQLHHDMRDWELDTFEGEKGWQPDQWADLTEVRNFSRELWDRGLTTPQVNDKQAKLFKD